MDATANLQLDEHSLVSSLRSGGCPSGSQRISIEAELRALQDHSIILVAEEHSTSAQYAALGISFKAEERRILARLEALWSM